MQVTRREFTLADYDAVRHLWATTGLFLGRSDSREGVAKIMRRDPASTGGGVGFYAALGYRKDELIFMEKWLT